MTGSLYLPSNYDTYEIEAMIPVTITLKGTGVTTVEAEDYLKIEAVFRLDRTTGKRVYPSVKRMSNEQIEVITYLQGHFVTVTAEPKGPAE